MLSHVPANHCLSEALQNIWGVNFWKNRVFSTALFLSIMGSGPMGDSATGLPWGPGAARSRPAATEWTCSVSLLTIYPVPLGPKNRVEPPRMDAMRIRGPRSRLPSRKAVISRPCLLQTPGLVGGAGAEI